MPQSLQRREALSSNGVNLQMDAILPGAVNESWTSRPQVQRLSSTSRSSAGASDISRLRPRAPTAAWQPVADFRSHASAGSATEVEHIRQKALVDPATSREIECQMRCGYLGNPHWHNLCSRCFYTHALLPALAYQNPGGIDEVARAASSKQNVSSRKTTSIHVRPGSRVLSSNERRVSDNGFWSFLAPSLGASGRVPVCLACITTLELGIFLFTLIVNGGVESLVDNPMIGPSVKSLYICGGLYIWQGKEPWRLVSCIFLHGGVLHIIPNVLLQFWAGYTLELQWGAVRFAEIYMSAGLGGSLLSAALSTRGVVSIGASGAVHGLFAARLVSSFAPVTRVHDPVAEKFIWRIILFTLVVSLALGTLRLDALPRVDSWCHLGGTLVGLSVAAAVFWSSSNKCSSRRCCCMAVRLFMAVFGLGFMSACIYGLRCDGCYEPPGSLDELMMR